MHTIAGLHNTMANVIQIHDEATAIADAAFRAQRSVAAQTALISQCMANLVAEGLEAQKHRNGRELAIFERDFDKIAILVDALVDGNYRDTAARLAGIAESGVRAWLKAADDGNERYQAVATLIRAAEAVAESDSVRHVRSAGKDPRFWTAAATWLERKYPDKYGRRNEDTSAPRVIVQIGVRDSDVQIQLAPAAPVAALPGENE
jgi:hypothetical protein